MSGTNVSETCEVRPPRRVTTGPAKALLRAIKNDPKAVLKALAN